MAFAGFLQGVDENTAWGMMRSRVGKNPTPLFEAIYSKFTGALARDENEMQIEYGISWISEPSPP